MRVLAGDIGGTKSLLAHVEIRPSERACDILFEHRYESKRYPGLASIVRDFLGRVKENIGRACFGIACPVIEDECTAPNLPWHIGKNRLAEEIGIARTEIVNDFIAAGYGLELLGQDDLACLQKGNPKPKAPLALIGAGTGLGEAFLLWQNDRYMVHASEGGHVDFAPRSDIETDLLGFLKIKYNHVSYERILSGSGLVNIYRFLVESGIAPETPGVRDEMASEDRAAVISRHGLAATDEACVKALDLFASIYGAQAGNLALTVMASGGAYIAGGIAPRIVDKLKDGTFIRSFQGKGRLLSFVKDVPVYVILNPKVGLLGAAMEAAYIE